MKAVTQCLVDTHILVHKWMTDSVSEAPKWLLVSGITAGIGLVTAFGYFYSKPEKVLQLYRSTAVWRAGFKVKSVKGTKYTYSYMERGSPKQGQASMLFIHGLSARKENWLPILQHLPRHIHVVVVDLLGHGQSSVPTDTSDATVPKLVECFEEFMSLVNLGVDPFHLIGASLGGTVAAMYTSKHCPQVDRLTLMAPAIKCPIESELWHLSVEEVFPQDPVQLKNVIGHLAYDQNAFPQSLWVYRGLIEERRDRLTFLKELFKTKSVTFNKEKKKFEETLTKITVPVQIIWGEEDKCVHVSGASLIESLIPTVKRTDILPHCGHELVVEQADVTKSLILDFYNCTYST